MIKISFLGGANEVGRSAILVDTGTEKILMDYGVKIDKKPTEYPKPVNAKVDGILATHSHLDHNGAVPLLFNQKHKCPVYGMEITKHLSRLLWFDSIKIAELEGESQKYSERDVRMAGKHFKPVEYRKTFKVGKTFVTAFDAGHMPGSAMFFLESGNKSILYTSDAKLVDTRLMKGADLDVPQVDVLITESTYSNREQADRLKEERKMIELIKETIANDGVAVLSCFAVSRAQELLLILDEYELGYPVYLDGMAQKATEIICRYPSLQREYNSVKRALQRLDVKKISNPEKRKKVIKEPCIIVTPSGMLSGGPVSYYIKKLHRNEESSLILSGYQVPGTEGDILLRTGKYVHDDVDLDVKMTVKKFDFSSHASRSELFQLVEKINPKQVFCVHGDSNQEFAVELNEDFAVEAFAPKNSDVVEIK